MNPLVPTFAGTTGTDAFVGPAGETYVFAFFYFGYAYLYFDSRTGAT